MTLGARLALPDRQPCPHAPAQAASALLKPCQHLQGELQVGDNHRVSPHSPSAQPSSHPHWEEAMAQHCQGMEPEVAMHSIQEYPTSPLKIAPAASPSAL